MSGAVHFLALAAHGVGDGLEHVFGIDARGRSDAHFYGEAREQAGGHVGADVHVKINGAGEEGIDGVEVVGAEAGYGIGRQGGVVGQVAKIGAWLVVVKNSAGDDSRGTLRADAEIALLMHDEGACGEVAETFLLAIERHGDDADEIEAGEIVDDADEVADHGFKEGDLSAGFFDDANFHNALAGRLAVPEDFKNCVVAPVEAECEEDKHSRDPGAEGVGNFVHHVVKAGGGADVNDVQHQANEEVEEAL
jgi:hypothetical protein